ncbi:MAG: hypothetical protein A2Z93_14925 [Curvibacter sp. GWA2_64_110]|nr:MAG: hypothetical protein A2Z93_14925 [Curvibacter sp. GWA2_64_110]HCY16654.1 hypothetical protein [Curvibacter sp.]
MNKRSLVTLAAGSVLAAALAPAYAAAGNPFAATQLKTGYQVAQADTKQKDGKCGEAKCGASKAGMETKASDKKKDGSCGGDKKPEASCGAKK